MESGITVQPVPGSAFSTLVDLLQWRATNERDHPGYTFLSDSEEAEENFNFADLDLRARAIGAWLQRKIATGDRVLLLFSPGLDYLASFFGCLNAGAIAVPASSPHPDRQRRGLQRLKSIFTDAQISLIFTSDLSAEKVDGPALPWAAY